MTSGKQLRTFENGYAAEFSEDSRSIFIASPNGKFQQIDLLGKTLNNWALENKVNFKSDNFNRWFFPQSGNLVTFWHLHNFKTGKSQRFMLRHGDAVVWGGPDRLRFHGVAPVKADEHVLTGPVRINITFRQTGP